MGKSWQRIPALRELLFVVLFSIVTPTLALSYYGSLRLFLFIAQMCGALVVLANFTCAMDFVNYLFAMQRRNSKPSSLLSEGFDRGEESISFSLIVPAYLPYEQGVIVETINTLVNKISYDKPYQVVLVYNMRREDETETMNLLVQRLQDIATTCPVGIQFLMKRCWDSTSKAENVSFALPLCTGNVVGILDADHQPLPTLLSDLENVWDSDVIAVQGPSIARNGERNLLTRFLSVEQEFMYQLNHFGSSQWRDFSFFGGSNGYWRKEALSSLMFDKNALTEDIDISLRALAEGWRIRFEPDVVSTELLPETVSALWMQRLRWAQGWFQCSYRHLLPLLRIKTTSSRQKFGLITVLFLRELWYYAMIMMTIVALSAVMRPLFGYDWHEELVQLFSLLAIKMALCSVLVIFPFELFLLYVTIPRKAQLGFGRLLLGVCFFLPFLCFLATAGLTAQLRELAGEREWYVTDRAKYPQKAKLTEAV